IKSADKARCVQYFEFFAKDPLPRGEAIVMETAMEDCVVVVAAVVSGFGGGGGADKELEIVVAVSQG
ncbi:hypothetical protein CF328_g8000, partial [Tilletia controversa]